MSENTPDRPLDPMSKAEAEGRLCDSCNYYPVDTKPYTFSPGSLRAFREGREPEKRRYCEICAETMVSSAHQYPDQYRETGEILRTIAWSHNRQMDEFRGGRDVS